MKKQSLFIILIISLALGVGIWRERHSTESFANNTMNSNPLRLSAGIALPVPQRLPKFQLEDIDGTAFTQESLKQRWSFVFFGYTTCPDICPTMLSSLHDLSQRLVGLPSVQFVFITIDPSHDSKEQLKEYLKHSPFGEKALKGVTGEKDSILALSQKLGVHISEDGSEVEKIEHSGALFLINPEGRLAAVFTNGTKPPAIAQDVKEIIHHYAMNG